MAVWEARMLLLKASMTTAQLFVMAAVIAVAIAVVMGVAVTSRFAVIRFLAKVYGEFFRGISMVVQLFWIYFVLPLTGLSISAMTAAVIALGICYGAYGMETVRAGLLGVRSGQYDASSALGLKRWTTFVHIVLPQAIRIMLPGLSNLLILILKGTSVTALITIPELTFTVSVLSNNYGPSLALFAFVIFTYYIFAKLVIMALRHVEKRMDHP